MNKKTMVSLVGFITLGLFAFGGGGCITGGSQEPDYFVLEAIPGESSPESNFSDSDSFHIAQVEVPAYLDDTRIVERTSGNQLSYAEFNRWSESLDFGIARVVANNLASSLGVLNYSNYPNRTRADNRYEISITVQRFERVPTGKVNIEGSWRLFRDRKQKLIVPFEESIKVVGLGQSATVRAMSVALRRISDRIAVRFMKYLEEESASVEP